MKTDAMYAEEIEPLNEDFDGTIKDLEKLSEMDTIKIEINEGLEEALRELESLRDQFSKKDSANLLNLCKNVVFDTITGQFEFAVMFIQTQRGEKTTTADKQNYEKNKANNDGSGDRQDMLFTPKEYGKLLATGGKDAANMAAYAALHVTMRELTQAVFEEIRITFREKGKESLKDIFIRFKERMGGVIAKIKSKWKDIFKGSLESAITSILSNIVVFIIDIFAVTLKKIAMMISVGFISLCQAVRILVRPPEGMDREEVNYQAAKVFTAGLITAASLGLNAAIEKLLQTIPGFLFPIPSIWNGPRTISDILAVTLSALAGGILSTITLYFMDKCRNSGKKETLQIQLVTQSGVVAHYKIAQTWVVLGEAYRSIGEEIKNSSKTLKQTQDEINKSGSETDVALKGLHNIIEKLQKRTKKRGAT